MTSSGGHFDKSQAVLRAVLESPPGIVIFALDRNYQYLAFNENHARTIKSIWGETVAPGVNMLDLIKREDDREKARRNFDRALAGESFTLHEAYGDEQLERRFYEDAYSPIRDEQGQVIGLTVYLTDITEKRKAELELEKYQSRLEELVKQRTAELEAAHAQLLHVQKLESLGVLAGGIAHDFNNLLAVILGHTELAIGLTPADGASRSHLSIVRQTALEARLLTTQLLGYSGKGKFVVQVIDVNELIDGMVPLLRASISRAITLSFALDPLAQVVEADVTQVRQVLMNLVTNAAEAIGDGVGSVTIRTRTIAVDPGFFVRTRARPVVAPGMYVCLEVEDTGSGMDERVQSKLFDPFFTTKFSGRGLGLAAVLGIVTGHRGSIAVRSAFGQGSTFQVLLPTAETARAAIARKQEEDPAVPSRTATLLVIDDEEGVRAMMSLVLESLGHRVLVAASGREGCALYERHRAQIDLVVLDLTMPEMNGEQTLRKLQAIERDVRVLVMTGYAEDDVRERFQREDLAGFLAKPFIRSELVCAIHAALAPERVRAS